MMHFLIRDRDLSKHIYTHTQTDSQPSTFIKKNMNYNYLNVYNHFAIFLF